MNAIFKVILENAVVYPKSLEKRDDALDIIYTKLIVNPIQKAWRSKSPEQKTNIASFISVSKKQCTCCYKRKLL